jgi:CubicO group peptidase (beta-lactamase class C family)
VKIKFLYTIIFLITTSMNIFSSNTDPDTTRFIAVDRLIEKSIRDSAFPGGVLVIITNNRIIYQKAYGRLTYEKDSPEVTDTTIYDIASLTKVIATTTAAMICYDRKLFDIEDRVAAYIPEFKQNDKGNVRIKNLLLHNSGLPAWKKYYGSLNTEEDVLNDIYALPLQYKTGTKMVYSDLGMITLGKILERVTGKSLDTFCKDEIFIPLEMNYTSFNPSYKKNIAPTEKDNYWRNKLIQGEVHDETAALLNGVAGHAGVFSTASDVSKIAKMLLNKGEINGERFISAETVKLFTTKYSDLSSRALGWDTKSALSSAGKKFSVFSFGHTGFTGTSVWADPIRNTGVIFLTNRVYPTRNNKKIFKVRPLLHDAVISAIEE